MRATHTMAGVLEHLGQQIVHLGLNTWQRRALSAMRRCRTLALGGHIDKCSEVSCGHLRLSYNSCRNRHCPKCQGSARERWIRAREEELLPVPYFHVVFTLPAAINRLALYRPTAVYGSLFKAAWATLQQFAADPKHLGADTGMIAILHTWGQHLSLHPHLHCIVPAGGLTKQNKRWISSKNKGKFLFPVKAMSSVFRAKYMAALRKLEPTIIDHDMGRKLMKNQWVVYAKRPFFGPRMVIEYLGRYTHRIAISEHRLQTVNNQSVSFAYKDYRQGGKNKSMTLAIAEFVRRFSMHILPKGFTRIRHYGILSATRKKRDLVLIRKQITQPIKYPQTEKKKNALPFDPNRCPKCGKQSMITLIEFDGRGPPRTWILALERQAAKKKK